MKFCRAVCLVLLAICLAGPSLSRAALLRVASYNVENYLDVATESRKAKPEDARAKVRESILAIEPDVIAFQEVGRESALKELQQSLKAGGLDLPHLEHVSGYDTNIFVAVLSKYPFKIRRPHTNDSFLLSGRRLRTSRGFAQVQVELSGEFSFTLLTGHLKSKRVVAVADEAEMRLEEAKLLREKVDALLAADPMANVVLLGDFNDTRDSRPVRTLIGRGKTQLMDTRPSERNGDDAPSRNPAWDPRTICWTYHYGKEDSFSRIDYILVSPGMAQYWSKEETYVLAAPNWGVASDHRPIVAGFNVPD